MSDPLVTWHQAFVRYGIIPTAFEWNAAGACPMHIEWPGVRIKYAEHFKQWDVQCGAFVIPVAGDNPDRLLQVAQQLKNFAEAVPAEQRKFDAFVFE